MVELEGDVIDAQEAITRLLRLQQIVCGWFPAEEKARPIDDKNPRLEALKDLLGNIDAKVIIWARFRADIAQIERNVGPQRL